MADLPLCETALRRLHDVGIIHGDTNRFNLMVERSTGQMRILDFEHAEPWEEEKARLEVEGLEAQLSEEMGLGATVEVVDGKEVIRTDPFFYPWVSARHSLNGS